MTLIASLADEILAAPRTEACRWWLVECRGGFDQRLIADLRQANTLALDIFERVRNEKREYRKRPIFPGYVFFNGNADQKWAAGRSIATLKIISIFRQDRIAEELANLALYMRHNPHPSLANLRRGTRVRVTAGPLLGLEGEYVKSLPGRIYVNLGILGKAGEASVSEDAIELI